MHAEQVLKSRGEQYQAATGQQQRRAAAAAAGSSTAGVTGCLDRLCIPHLGRSGSTCSQGRGSRRRGAIRCVFKPTCTCRATPGASRSSCSRPTSDRHRCRAVEAPPPQLSSMKLSAHHCNQPPAVEALPAPAQQQVAPSSETCSSQLTTGTSRGGPACRSSPCPPRTPGPAPP